MTSRIRKKLKGSYWNKPFCSPGVLSLYWQRASAPFFLWTLLGVWSSRAWNWAGLGLCHPLQATLEGPSSQPPWPPRPLPSPGSACCPHRRWLPIQAPESQPSSSPSSSLSSLPSTKDPDGFAPHPITYVPSIYFVLDKVRQAIMNRFSYLPSWGNICNRKQSWCIPNWAKMAKLWEWSFPVMALVGFQVQTLDWSQGWKGARAAPEGQRWS